MGEMGFQDFPSNLNISRIFNPGTKESSKACWNFGVLKEKEASKS
jgi:hypothetical protein